eukprot:882378-Prorocentrum_lima.AAC.1
MGHKVGSPTSLLETGFLFKVYHPKDCHVVEGHQDREHQWMPVNQLAGFRILIERSRHAVEGP